MDQSRFITRKIVYIVQNGHVVMNVDPVSRKAAKVPKQFYIDAWIGQDGLTLTPVEIEKYIENPLKFEITRIKI